MASNLSGVQDVATGYYHTIALMSDGTVRAWGQGGNGALGNGNSSDSPTPVTVQGLSNVKQVACGMYTSYALKNDGTVWAWGYNAQGQVGDGSTSTRFTPVQVSGLTNAKSIGSVCYYWATAVKNDGTVWCWGYNNYGQLGDGGTTQRNTPIQTQGDRKSVV